MDYCKNLIFILCQSCLGSVAHFYDFFAQLGINPSFGKALKVAKVIWRPLQSRIKVYTDGLSKNNPRLSVLKNQYIHSKLVGACN